MSDRLIWVVMGSTGEYSDHREWPVCAYESEAVARKHADDAAARSLAFKKGECEHGEEMRDFCGPCKRYSYSDKAIRAWMGDLDPEATAMDYTGSDYYAMSVRLRAPAPTGDTPTKET